MFNEPKSNANLWALDICTWIKKNRKELIDILTQVETYKTAEDEIYRSLHCLENIFSQEKYFGMIPVDKTVVYLPLNQPLYSFILFVVIPSRITNKVYARPPVLLNRVFKKIDKVFKSHITGYEFRYDSRKKFGLNYTSNADVVIFTGKYENAKSVKMVMKENSLMLFNGGGATLVVVTDNSDINECIEEIVSLQTYNSGQDCMTPSAIFVENTIYNKFINKLIIKLEALSVDNLKNEDTDIGPILSMDSIEKTGDVLSKSIEKIIYGAKIDYLNKIVYPTILEIEIDSELLHKEIYSPIFCVINYSDVSEIEKLVNEERMRERASYISVFDEELEMDCGQYIRLSNKTINSIDDGNQEFGGYGILSSFVSYNDKIISRPILISKEVYNYYNSKKVFNGY